MNTATQTNDLPTMLRQARHARRISKLELPLRMGVSQRHVSFVEGGRFWLSRELLSPWLQELDTPLALRNAAMLQAGYALIYSAAPLGDPSLARADEAMAQLVQVHDPMPSLLIDAQWNVLRLNQGSRWLAPTLMPGAAGLLRSAPLNMLDLLAHPEAARRDRRLMADGRPREDAAEWLLHLTLRSSGLELPVCVVLLPVDFRPRTPARDPYA